MKRIVNKLENEGIKVEATEFSSDETLDHEIRTAGGFALQVTASGRVVGLTKEQADGTILYQAVNSIGEAIRLIKG